MRDFGDYLRAYWDYLLTNPGRKVLVAGLVWLGGMFAPLGVGALVELPTWAPMTWMVGWSVLGYIFAPYGLWRHHRAQAGRASQSARSSRALRKRQKGR